MPQSTSIGATKRHGTRRTRLGGKERLMAVFCVADLETTTCVFLGHRSRAGK